MALKDSDRKRMKKSVPEPPRWDFSFNDSELPQKDESELISFKDLKAPIDENIEKASNETVRKGASVIKEPNIPKAKIKKVKEKEKSDLPLKSKFLLMALIKDYNITQDKPFLEKSVNDISKSLYVSKRSAQLYLRKWEEAGILTTITQFDPSTKKPTKYKILESLF